MNINIFTLVGEIIVLGIIILLIAIIITIILGIYLLRKNKLIFPKILLFTLNFTYPSIKYLLQKFQFDDLIIDRISIDLRNKLNEKKFKELDAKDVIMVLPHCLRAMNCPAKLGHAGLECIKCGKCSIGTFKKISDEKGIGMYIVPGSTFIKHVIKIRKFKGVIGVACPLDLNTAMTALSNYTVQGIYLLNDGCINTLVNEDEVIYLMNILKPKTSYTK
ncbi:DUF116 domain-containing protein [Methanosphaera sp. WGK6]|uniref:DUF116 domain-containing protein n=1 Tax=Methanosphaera sp. WGK6 TaxID=1561964 RepID=UPI00084CB123|nr:DUF116 domain-containing protein [Methanosphaera sp. WGK6]OED30641.1 hypothetical protein NL43_01490 [Methanosphaera sp. WGK6]